MGIYFTPQDGAALYDLLAEQTDDLIVKTDRDGFIIHGAGALARLGLDTAGGLIGPHIADLAEAPQSDDIRRRHRALIEGRNGEASGSWIEFRAASRCRERAAPWFALQMRAIEGPDGAAGSIAVIRSIDDRRSLEERLFASSMTDPLTGLTNRRAFSMMLAHLIERGTPGSVILFEIDHYRAIAMRHGQSVSDEVLEVFAEFLRVMTRSSEILSRIDGECFAVLLPYQPPAEARALGQPILDTLDEIRRSLPGRGVAVTASGGIAAIGPSVDATMREAGLALMLAKSRGGGSLELAGGRPLLHLAGERPLRRAARG
jgi:diguanylate cyclase (GGDEF)-like protein/PAS domain S-box-containing protein